MAPLSPTTPSKEGSSTARERKKRYPEGRHSGRRSHSQEWQSENGTHASLPRTQAPFPTEQPPVSGLVPQREEGDPPCHTCWWLRWTCGQERRCGTGSHSAAFRARCLGRRLEGKEGSCGECSSQPLLAPGAPGPKPATGVRRAAMVGALLHGGWWRRAG